MREYFKRTLWIYGIAIAIPVLVGLLSALITKGDMNIYSEITKPPLSPPALLFPIVWSILYILMGISSGTVYIEGERVPDIRKKAIGFYLISLVFNFGWSIIFFTVRDFFIAFIWLLVLLYFIIRTIIEYKKIVPIAAYLQVPYAVWAGFAGYLNLAIVILNR